MANIDLLNSILDEMCISKSKLCRRTNMPRQTLYNRLSGRYGKFSEREIMAIQKVLHLTNEQRDSIFFQDTNGEINDENP